MAEVRHAQQHLCHLLPAERLQVLSRLAGSLAHELHNPLTTISLYADIMEGELRQPDGGNRAQLLPALTVIREEVGRLYDLMQQYLWLMRLPHLQREPEDLGACLASCGQEMQSSLAARDVTLTFAECHHLGYVALHKPTFHAMLRHLLASTTEAMPGGGTITVRGQRLATQVRLEVSHTGDGTSTARLPSVVRPLQTTASTRVDLGLYVVREMVTAHDGEITVTSTPGEGITVALLLPSVPGPGGR